MFEQLKIRMEVTIIENDTALRQRFARCNNSKCRTFFLLDSKEILGEAGFLCPTCRDKIDSHHLVQCSNCQSIINFIAAEPSEEPVIFNVQKCSRCNGTVEDEWEMKPYYYPDAFI